MNVLLLSASAGAGHVRAAEALEKAFRAESPDCRVLHLDVLKYASGLMRKLYATTYFELARVAPELLGWFYSRTDRPWKSIRRRTAFDRLNLAPVVKIIVRAQPGLIVCTHFTPAEIVSWLKARDRLSCPQAVVVTDFDAHGMWLVPTCDRYFVARDEMKVYMAANGVDARKIAVTGIPIDPVFERPKARRAMRVKHGLDPDLATVLISAGGFGVGPVEAMLKSLRTMRHPAQVVAVCGRNEVLRRRIARLARTRGRVRFRVVGFTSDMDEYMAAADLLLGKPGGLTTSEALARGIGLAIVNPIPGQEERNADFLLEEGAAIRCNNPPALAWKLDCLLSDRRKLAALKAAARRLGRPRAARDIARNALALAREP